MQKRTPAVLAAIAITSTLAGCAAMNTGSGWTPLIDGTNGMNNFNRVGDTNWVATDGDASVISGLSGGSCTSKELRFRLYDVNNNPMPHKTTVSIGDTTKVLPGTVSPNIVPSTNSIGGTVHSVLIKPGPFCEADTPSVRVTTPGGTSYTFGFSTAL